MSFEDIDCIALEVFPRVPDAFDQKRLAMYVIKKRSKHENSDNQSISLDCGVWGLGASYDKGSNTVRLRKGVCVDGLKGMLVGTYLMDQIINWAKKFDDAVFAQINLTEGLAYDENRHRRNRFYQRYGFVFDFGETIDRSGHSLPILVSELQPLNTWKGNIRESTIQRYIDRQDSKIEFLDRELTYTKSDAAKSRDDFWRLNDMPILQVAFQRFLTWLECWGLRSRWR